MQDQQYLKWFNTFQDQNKVLKSELSKVIIGQDDIIWFRRGCGVGIGHVEHQFAR